jgi:hypothetical protein
MGGYGSGFHSAAKGTTRERHTLPLASFKNLPPGAAVSWTLTRGGSPIGAVQIGVTAQGLALTFTPPGGEPWQQTILITRVPVTFGGERPWLVCPHCWQHTATLYLGRYRYACRTCNGLNYQSTRETHGDRAVRKADKLRRRLGWVPGVAFGHGPKPKGMHWQTFGRLVREHDQNAGRFYAGVQTWLDRKQGR